MIRWCRSACRPLDSPRSCSRGRIEILDSTRMSSSRSPIRSITVASIYRAPRGPRYVGDRIVLADISGSSAPRVRGLPSTRNSVYKFFLKALSRSSSSRRRQYRAIDAASSMARSDSTSRWTGLTSSGQCDIGLLMTPMPAFDRPRIPCSSKSALADPRPLGGDFGRTHRTIHVEHRYGEFEGAVCCDNSRQPFITATVKFHMMTLVKWAWPDGLDWLGLTRTISSHVSSTVCRRSAAQCGRRPRNSLRHWQAASRAGFGRLARPRP